MDTSDSGDQDIYHSVHLFILRFMYCIHGFSAPVQ